MRRMQSKKGSVLIGVIIVAIVFGAVVGGYLTSSTTEYKLSSRTLYIQSALNLAESGLEEAMWSVTKGDWSAWTNTGTESYFKDIDGILFSSGRVGRIRVYIEDADTMPIIVAEGRVTDSLGMNVFKQIRVDLKTRSMFANGLTAKNRITFNGNGPYVDAYDSRMGPWDMATNRTDEGSVASVAVTNNMISGNNGNVWGNAATGGGDPTVGSQGSIGPDGTSNGEINWDNVSKTFKADLPDGTAPALSSPLTSLSVGNNTTVGSAGVATEYHLERLTMDGQKKITVYGDVTIVLDRNLSMSGQAEIIIPLGSSLKLYAAESISISGNGIANQTNIPENFQIFGTATVPGGQSFDISGNGAFCGVAYVPNAEVQINGGGSSGIVSGAIIGNNITLNGNVEFHYDLALKDFGGDGSYTIDFWRELKSQSERLDFNDMAALASGVAPL